MNNDIESILYTKQQLDDRMDEIAAQITKKYRNEQPLVVSVLNGAMIFTANMLTRLNFKLNLDVIKASSYVGAKSSGQVKIVQDLNTDVKGRRVILMEDIIDTGRTLKYLSQVLKDRGAKSVEICTMLDKPETRTVDLKGNYVGFLAPDEFLVGYGLDYDGLYRNLPYIGILKRQVYQKSAVC